MKSWRVNTDTDRPIPRRILESAVVDRRPFGWGKRVVMRCDWLPNSPGLRRAYRDFVKEAAPIGARQAAQEWLSKGEYIVERVRGSVRLARFKPDVETGLKRRFVPAHADLQQLMFKWAVERLTSRYRDVVYRPLPSI